MQYSGSTAVTQRSFTAILHEWPSFTELGLRVSGLRRVWASVLIKPPLGHARSIGRRF